MRHRVATEALLAHLPLFEGLGSDGLARLGACVTRVELRRGDVLFREGDLPTALYAVVFGRIQLSTSGPGRRRVVGLIDAGESFGEAVMFLERRSLVTASAAVDSLVLQVPKEAVLDELARNAAFVRRVIGNLSQRIEQLVRELHGYRAGSGADRFIAWLMRRPGIPSSGGSSVTLPAPKAAIAGQLNLSAEQLSRILHDLAAAGLLSVHGRELRIPDVERLAGASARPAERAAA
jgi:CRP-like cAMP-binding protein